MSPPQIPLTFAFLNADKQDYTSQIPTQPTLNSPKIKGKDKPTAGKASTPGLSSRHLGRRPHRAPTQREGKDSQLNYPQLSMLLRASWERCPPCRSILCPQPPQDRESPGKVPGCTCLPSSTPPNLAFILFQGT